MSPPRELIAKILAILLFLLITILALTIATATYRTDVKDRLSLVEKDARGIAAAIEERIGRYETILRAAQAYLANNSSIRAREWRDFLQDIRIYDNAPGVLGLAYLQKETLYSSTGKSSIHCPVVFAEPEYSMKLPLHKDICKNQAVANVLELALKENKPILSPRIYLQGETVLSPEALLIAPVSKREGYDSDSEAAGWLLMPISPPLLLKKMLDGVKAFDFHLYDAHEASHKNLVYDRDEHMAGMESAEHQHQDRISAKETINLMRHNWVVEVMAPKPSRTIPIMIGIAGTILGLLSFGYVWGLIRTRKDAEEIARKMTEDLRRNEAELARHAQDLIKRNREMSRLAEITAHDLQEPLRNIASYAQLIERRTQDRLEPDIKEYIEFMTQGCRQMKSLLSELLRYHSIDHMPKERTRPQDTSKCLQQVLADFKDEIRKSQANINIGTMPIIDIDPNQFSIVLGHLIGNALKYRSSSRPLEIKIDTIRKPGEWIFFVQDNGIGIDSHHFERIFQIFERLHHQKEYLGTGVGLAICRKIVEKFGGRIWVESEPDKGACFFFSLSDYK